MLDRLTFSSKKKDGKQGPKVAARRAAPPRKPERKWRKRLAKWGGIAAALAAGWWLAGHFYGDQIKAVRDQAQAVLADAAAEAGMTVKEIRIIGRKRTAQAAIVQALNTQLGAPLLGVDLEAAHKELVAIPWVDSVRVQRRLPGLITVTLIEREPMAVWDRDDKLVLIDAAGNDLDEAEKLPESWADLPLVKGVHSALKRSETGEMVSYYTSPPDTRAMLAAIKARPAVQQRTSYIEWVGGRRWDIVLADQTRIKLPEEGVDAALDRLLAQHAEHKVLDNALHAIDLRLPDRTTLQTSATGALRAPVSLDDDPAVESPTR